MKLHILLLMFVKRTQKKEKLAQKSILLIRPIVQKKKNEKKKNYKTKFGHVSKKYHNY